MGVAGLFVRKTLGADELVYTRSPRIQLTKVATTRSDAVVDLWPRGMQSSGSIRISYKPDLREFSLQYLPLMATKTRHQLNGMR